MSENINKAKTYIDKEIALYNKLQDHLSIKDDPFSIGLKILYKEFAEKLTDIRNILEES